MSCGPTGSTAFHTTEEDEGIHTYVDLPDWDLVIVYN